MTFGLYHEHKLINKLFINFLNSHQTPPSGGPLLVAWPMTSQADSLMGHRRALF